MEKCHENRKYACRYIVVMNQNVPAVAPTSAVAATARFAVPERINSMAISFENTSVLRVSDPIRYTP